MYISKSSKGTNLVMTRAHFFMCSCDQGYQIHLGWYEFPSFPLKAKDVRRGSSGDEATTDGHKVANIAANGLALA